jgi:antitoxin CptB
MQMQKTTDEASFRKQLAFQSRHRGVKELDLVLGRFAETCLADLPMEELRRYAEFIEEADPDIYDWLIGRAPLPERLRNSLTEHLLDFVQDSSKIGNDKSRPVS